jgi:Short C-terminal domain
MLQFLFVQAQSGQPFDYSKLARPLSILVGVLIVAMVIVSWVRKRLKEPDEPASAGFTLSDLRQLHKSGQMSDEEFERAKAKVVEAARRTADRQAARQAGTSPDMKNPDRLQ